MKTATPTFKKNTPSEVIRVLTDQKLVPRWAIADEALLDSIAAQAAFCRGPNGKKLQRLFRFFGDSFLSLFLLRVIGIVECTRWWWLAGDKGKFPKVPFRLFFGFGAGSEKALWKEYLADSTLDLYRIDQTSPGSFGALGRPPLIQLIRCVWQAAASIVSGLQRSEGILYQYREEFIVYTAIRIGSYAFCRNWWDAIKKSDLKHVLFLSADTPAFACIDAGIACAEYLQHGLLRRSVIFPEFSKMHLLTKAEADHLKSLLPFAQIMIRNPAALKPHCSSTRTLLIASMYDMSLFVKNNSSNILKHLFSWAENQKIRIVVRPHPKEDRSFWKENFSVAELVDQNVGFSELLDQEKPMFVVSWFSTALIDALRNGVLPVTLSPRDDRHVSDMIIPLHGHCLSWPDDMKQMEEVMANSSKYQELVDRFRKGLFE